MKKQVGLNQDNLKNNKGHDKFKREDEGKILWQPKYKENIGSAEVPTPQNAALLLIDHQVGLMQLVRDMTPEEYKNILLGLAKTAKHFGLPVILTTSRDYGPNGPILPELKQLFPNVAVIRRTGVFNAWLWPAFREAVDETRWKKLSCYQRCHVPPVPCAGRRDGRLRCSCCH